MILRGGISATDAEVTAARERGRRNLSGARRLVEFFSLPPRKNENEDPIIGADVFVIGFESTRFHSGADPCCFDLIGSELTVEGCGEAWSEFRVVRPSASGHGNLSGAHDTRNFIPDFHRFFF